MILGIETSCDETAAALVTDEGEIRSSVVSSQAELHARYGGVVPEVASRRHLELVTPVIREALAEADATLGDVDRGAATRGPGLIGALLSGLAAGAGAACGERGGVLGLGDRGGRVIDRLAGEGDPNACDFPVARVPGLDFSFSGLKTALLYAVRDLDKGELEARRADLAASYQHA